jgi:cell division transport system permease protein
MGIKSAVQGLPGVNTVRDLREVLKPIYLWMGWMKWGAIGIAAFLVVAAVLQVGNTIRLAAFARRREIGIMRLVGASSLYIQLPFLMESLVAAVIGVGLAAAALVAFMWLVIYQTLRPTSNIVAWIDWGDGIWAVGCVALIGLALTLLPTLVMTRKYLKV